MNDISELIDAAARAAVEHNGTIADGELAAVLQHGSDARLHVWDRHYANADERRRLDQKLATSSPEFQSAVAAVERVLAEELADDNVRRARVRAENPGLFKEY
ncbi:hypothetical protein C7441_104141 [Pseudaminobacter salicylatoxidans]|uniref:Uncharacterized protein n=1 Tax=Pseudaminobacter salicylatoxidans TaxID=93369 RepID=A0A316C6C8_PSESE|nr:hypothetical protein [Pseudaminobacter salicylatoxidans]PWJ84873.1 hypothetical protein C7441_104141 [Pseudaminobacter salicylatoxidans]